MVSLRINGEVKEVDVDPATPLLWVLREQLGLTGAKFGCGMAHCGACTVHVDGIATRACVTLLRNVAGKDITTIEGLAGGQGLHPVQNAWLECSVPQCGYCQPGQIMAAAALLKAKPRPTDDEIDAVMAGNLCRCGTYPRIKKAIKKVAAGG